MSLKEEALLARKNEQMSYSMQRVKERDKSLDELIENWPKRWHLKLEEVPPIPKREQFRWEKLAHGDGRGRNPHSTGWAFVVDDLEFIYDKEHGMCVVLTCPECGGRHTESFYGLSGLGKLLKDGRSYLHKCHQVAARELAYAIKAASRETNLSASAILDEALEIYQGFAP